jgi:general secretion pathway protein K
VKPIRRQTGAALLMAMLTVALVATFAAAALWQQYRSIEVEASERARVQADWVLTGALDFSRLLLREDAMPTASKVDHLGEPWAVPLQEARLSSFLAANKEGVAEEGPQVLDAFLSGQIIDEQSLLNVNNLAVGGQALDADLRIFARLFDLLGLPQTQLEQLAENLRFANDTSEANRSGPKAPLAPQTVEQLVWLGVPATTVAALQPYVTLLKSPQLQRTKVNLNTASAEVIYAAIDGVSMADAQRLVSLRERTPFETVAAAMQAIGFSGNALEPASGNVDVRSDFFEIRARLRLDPLVVEERSVVWRNGHVVTVIRRERGVVDPTAMTRIAAGR